MGSPQYFQLTRITLAAMLLLEQSFREYLKKRKLGQMPETAMMKTLSKALHNI